MPYTPTPRELQWLRDEKYAGNEPPAFHDDVERLKKGEPLDYIIGNAPFLGCTINLSFRPLIPRAETEYWVERALKTIPSSTPVRILDIFAGSGCIGIALAKHRPNATVDLAELDANALKQIKKNILLNKVKNAKTFKSDAFNHITKTYEYIFANPPYIAPDATDVQPTVKDWEPSIALYADDNGLAVINETIARGHEHLTPGGTLYIEHGPRQSKAIAAYAKQFPYARVTTLKDQYGKERVTKLVKKD